MSKPFTPKSSPLAGRSPSVPETSVQEEPAEAVDPAQEPTHRPAAASARSAAAKEKKERRNFYSTPSDHARTEAARKYTMGFTDYTSYTAFVEAAVNEKTRQLEAEHNDGRPWT